MNESVEEGRVDSLLKANHVQARFGALEAVRFSPSQPFHWLGLAVLLQHPVLWFLALLSAIMGGWLVYDVFIFYFANDGVLLTGENRLLLMPVVLSIYPISVHKPLLVIAFALIPIFVVGNFLLAVACGLVTGQRPHWRWMLSGLLGVVPLRLFAGRFMPKWKFWGGEQRGVMGVDARLFQFSVIYGLVCKKTRPDMELLWIHVFEKRLKDIFDSLYSYIYIAPVIAYSLIGVVGFSVIRLLPSSTGLGGVDSASVVVAISLCISICFFVWLGFTRFLLAMTVFALLRDRDFDVVPGDRTIRLMGMLVVTVAGALLVMAGVYLMSGRPLVSMPADAAASDASLRRFLWRIEAGPGLMNGLREGGVVSRCFDDNGAFTGAYVAPVTTEPPVWDSAGQVSAANPMPDGVDLSGDRVAVIEAGQLRFMAGASRLDLNCARKVRVAFF